MTPSIQQPMAESSHAHATWSIPTCIVVGFLLLAFFMGSFDVFLASNGLPAVHTCYKWGTIFSMQTYCDGPWSTQPFTPELRQQLALQSSSSSSR